MRILQIIIDPIIAGKPLTQRYGVNVKELHNNVLKILSSISGESMPIVRTEYQSFIPVKWTGVTYSAQHYEQVINRIAIPYYPDLMDYDLFIRDFKLIERRGEFDEVHVWGGPYFGFYESRMIGRNPIWCNAPPLKRECDNFIIMSFNYERGISEALEAFAHRVESILAHNYPTMFRAYQRQVGTVHIPFNTTKDYDWSNETMVRYRNYLFPNFTPTNLLGRMANCQEWGCTGLGYMQWWLRNLPKNTWTKILHP